MNDELQTLENLLRQHVGKFLRYQNEILEQFGQHATDPERIEVAQRIHTEPCRGIAGGMWEQIRLERRNASRTTVG